MADPLAGLDPQTRAIIEAQERTNPTQPKLATNPPKPPKAPKAKTPDLSTLDPQTRAIVEAQERHNPPPSATPPVVGEEATTPLARAGGVAWNIANKAFLPNIMGALDQRQNPVYSGIVNQLDQWTGGTVGTLINKGMDAGDALYAALGAFTLDAERGHFGDPNGPAAKEFRALAASGDFGKLKRTFSIADPQATRLRAQMTGEPVAQWLAGSRGPADADVAKFVGAQMVGLPGMSQFAQWAAMPGHPTVMGGVAGALQYVNPIWHFLGHGASAGVGALKTGARAAGVHVGRFSPIAEAAAREAKATGKPVVNARLRARAHAENIANAPHYAKHEADEITKKVFDGLSLSEQHELLDLIEAEHPGLGDERSIRLKHAPAKTIVNPGTPEEHYAEASPEAQAAAKARADREVADLHAVQNAPRFKVLQQRLKIYRDYMEKLDADQVQAGLDPARLWRTERFAPRKGSTLHPEHDEEQDPNVQEALAKYRTAGVGGTAYRKGTAGENIHRVHRSYRAAQRAGVQMNPDWRFSDAFHKHVMQRQMNVRLEGELKGLEDLGLIEPRDISTRPDYAEFTDFGRVRNFGAPTTREGRVHTSVVDLVADTQNQAETHGITTMGTALGEVAPMLSRQAARATVTNPIYHPAWNILRNYFRGDIREVPKKMQELVKAFGGDFTGAESKAAGGALGGVSAMPMGMRVLKYGERPRGPLLNIGVPGTSFNFDLSQRAMHQAEHPFNRVSSEPVYGFFEPRMSEARYQAEKHFAYKRAIKRGETPEQARQSAQAEAVHVTRRMVGQPEAIPAKMRPAAKQFIYPSWHGAMLRDWLKSMLTDPASYVAPHAMVGAHNLGYGVGPQPSDPYRWIPNWAFKTPDDKTMMMPVPHPGNFLTSMVRVASPGESPQTKAQTLVNTLAPSYATAARVGAAMLMKPGRGGAGQLRAYDPQNPEWFKELMTGIPGGYTPARQSQLGAGQPGLESPLLSAFGSVAGVAPYEYKPRAQAIAINATESSFRKSISSLMGTAADLRRNGDIAGAQALEAQAKTQYKNMQEALKNMGADQP